MIVIREDISISDEVNDVEIYSVLLRKNKKANDLLHEAIVIYDFLAKSFWQYKLQNKSSISKTDNNSEIDIAEKQVEFHQKKQQSFCLCSLGNLYILGMMQENFQSYQ